MTTPDDAEQKPGIEIRLTHEQADAVITALDLMTRVGMGELTEVANLARFGLLNKRSHDSFDKPDIQDIEAIEEQLAIAKHILGHPRNGSFGIGHPGVPLTSKRAYEVQKTLQETLWDYRNPGDRMSVHSDGLTVRYTDDPRPVARLVDINSLLSLD